MDDNISGLAEEATAVTTDEAVGVSLRVCPPRFWYIAIVKNRSERVCQEKLRRRCIETQASGERAVDTYIPIQQEVRVSPDGRRRKVDRIVLPAMVFIRCTERVRRREIAYLPYINRFVVNSAGTPVNGHRPVAIIPESQMLALQRMVADADEEVMIEQRPLHIGERVRVTSGKLAGLEGNILRHSDGSTSIVVLIDVLGCARMTISRTKLERIG